MGRHEVKHTPKALRLHQVAVDRLIDLAVKRREAERELREYAVVAPAVAETMRRG